MDTADRLAIVEQTARYKLPASTRVLVSRELRRLARVLYSDERLQTLAQARMDEATGLLAVTDRRIVFIGRHLVIEERVLHAQRAEFPFSEIKKVEAELRPLSGTVIIHQAGRRSLISDINPPERAPEIEALARVRIAEERKTKKDSPSVPATAELPSASKSAA